MSRVRIDRVEIRVKGGSEASAGALARELRGALPQALAAPRPADAHVRLAPGTSAAQAAAAVAAAIAGKVAER
jgi:hypothetical protein